MFSTRTLKGRRELGILVFSASLLLYSAARATDSGVVIHVPSQVIVKNDHVLLGDVAEIRTSDNQLLERLKNIELGFAPNVGVIREISKEKLLVALAAAGIQKSSFVLNAPAVFELRRSSQQVDTALVYKAVEDGVLTDLTSKGVEAKLVRLDLPSGIEAPSGQVEVRASASGVKDHFSPFTLSIEIWVDGRSFRRLSTTAQLEGYADVVVAKRDMAEKVRVSFEDFQLERRKLLKGESLYLRDRARLRGVSLRKSVRSGEPVTVDLLVSEIVVKPGDSLKCVSESKSIKIFTTVEARASGRVGDRIQVKNVQSGMLLQATIVDEGMVKVIF
jgi:flagellar basal body P-ring formation protein FlgA